MTDVAHNITLPPEIADAMETAGLSPEVPTLMKIIEDFAKAEAEVKASPDAEPVERMWPLMKLLPVDVDYQKAFRAAKSGRNWKRQRLVAGGSPPSARWMSGWQRQGRAGADPLRHRRRRFIGQGHVC